MRYKRRPLNLFAGYDEIEVDPSGISFLRKSKADRYAWSDIESIHDHRNEQRNYKYPGLPSSVTETLIIKTRSGRTYRIVHFGLFPHIHNSESFLPEIERYYSDIIYSDNTPLL